MRPQELSIGTEVFADLRIKMDMALNAAISNLISKDLSSGKISVKINIEMTRNADEETGEIWYEPKFEPSVSVSVGAKGKVDCNPLTGLILKKSSSGRNYISTNQISMDEMQEEDISTAAAG